MFRLIEEALSVDVYVKQKVVLQAYGIFDRRGLGFCEMYT